MTGQIRVLLAEAAGTFMFFFVGAGAIIATGGDNLIAIALAHGLGLPVAADILAGGPITGAAMNPARWFGTAVPAGFYDHWYVYFIGPLVGAALAGLSYRFAFAPPPDLAPSTPPRA